MSSAKAVKTKPNCSKSQPCGYACIETKDTCRELLASASDEAQLITAYVDLISSAPARAAKQKGDDLMRPDEAKAYLAYLDSGEKPPAKKQDISEEALEKVWQSIPSKVRGDLKKKGSPCSRKGEDLNPMCGKKGKEANDYWEARGKGILKALIDSNFEDPLTGEFMNWRDLEPDHIVPLSAGGKDEASNLTIVNKRYNQNKNNVAPEVLRAKLERMANMTPAEYEQELAAAKGKNNAKAEREKAWADNIPLMDDNTFSQKVDSAGTDDLKSILKAIGIGRSFINASRGVYGTKDTQKALAKLSRGLLLTEAEQKSLDADLAKSESKTTQDPAEKLANILAKIRK